MTTNQFCLKDYQPNHTVRFTWAVLYKIDGMHGHIPAGISCTHPEVIQQVQPGDRVHTATVKTNTAADG
jgi:hypothetical protein